MGSGSGVSDGCIECYWSNDSELRVQSSDRGRGRGRGRAWLRNTNFRPIKIVVCLYEVNPIP